MKITINIKVYSLLWWSLLTFTACKVHLRKEKNKQIITGLKPEQNIISGFSHYNGDLLTHQSKLKKPNYYDKLPLSLNNGLNTGEISEANSIGGNDFYYNGASNLSAIKVMCGRYSMFPGSCVGNSSCGWCGSNNSCVPGTVQGPIGNCLRGSYVYTAPKGEWNPFNSGNINLYAQDKALRPWIHLTQTPDMNSVNVHKPYY